MTATHNDESNARLRWGVYGLLIALATGNMIGRLMAVNSVDRISVESHLERAGRDDWRQQRPFLSANDRSRWATIRSLVEHGTYAIDLVVAEPHWDTIDMVKHKDRDGVPRLYSSKPPLLPTLIAGEYWLIHRFSGATLGTHPYEIGRFMLITLNVIPLIVMFVLLAGLVERFGTTDWGRLFVMAAATWGTFLSTFAVVLNNHLIAAVSVTVALAAAVPIWLDGERRLRYFSLAGLATAFTAANELPALALFAALTTALLWRAPRPTLIAYVPASLLVVAGFFGTNYAAHNCLTPPYAHRSDVDPDDNWYHFTYERGGRERLSYWQTRQGIDVGEPSKAIYALHVLVGHHGIFSLTPIWLLSVVGLATWIAGSRRELRELALLIAAVSLVCIVFYIALRPQMDRNYGGMTSGFRWMFWFAPLWLVAMLPAADSLSGVRWRRGVGLVLLVLSVLSASYPTWNPWTYPWLTNLLMYLEWVTF